MNKNFKGITMKNILKIIIIILTGLVLINPVSATWFDNNYFYKIDNPIPNGSRSIQIMWNVSSGSGTNNITNIYCNNHCKSDLSDIRFVLNDNLNLSYWIENLNYGTGTVWVNITGNGTVSMYYGNLSALSLSNGATTFPLFDNFTGASINTSMWTRGTAGGSTTISNGNMTITGGSTTWEEQRSVLTFGTNYAIKYKFITNANDDNHYQAGFGQNGLTSASVNMAGLLDSVLKTNKASSGQDTSRTNDLTVWNTMEIIRDNTSSVIFKFNDTTVATHSTQVPTVNMNIYFARYSTGTLKVDWIFAYNYSIVTTSWGNENARFFLMCTPTATSITTNSVVINCVMPGISGTSWIQYGGYSNAYKFRTDYKTVTIGNFSTTIKGIPLQSGGTYYYRQMINYNGTIYTSDENNFILSTVTPITDYQFDRHTEELAYSDLNITTMTIIIPEAYTDVVGSIFWGIVFSIIFIMIWLRQEDISIPALLGLLIGGSLWSFMPAEWVSFSYSLVIVSFAGLMYSLIKTKS